MRTVSNHTHMHRTTVAVALTAASCSAAFGSAPELIQSSEPLASKVLIDTEPNANRGIQDCDGNGIDDAIDRANDFASASGFVTVGILPCVVTTIETVGPDFDTEMALFDDQGTLLASNDDIVPGNLLSIVSLPLDPGIYYVAVT